MQMLLVVEVVKYSSCYQPMLSGAAAVAVSVV